MAQYQRKVRDGWKWYYKFDYKNNTYRSHAVYLSKNEAKKAESIKYEEVANKRLNPSQKPFFSLLQIINERLDYVQVKKTIDYYKDNKRYYTAFLKHFGNADITTISKKDITKYLLEMSKEAQAAGRDNYAVNYMLNLFKALFNHAISNNDELEMRNPCEGIELFSVKKKMKYIPSDEDIIAVKNLCNDRQKLLIDFVMVTGARINEPLKVTGKDITTDSVILHTKKSRNSNIVPRKVPKPECIAHLNLKPDERLFSDWSDAPKFLERKIEILKQRKWNWHNLRHRKASLWNKAGKSLFEIMSLLGHSQLSTTQKYLQLLP